MPSTSAKQHRFMEAIAHSPQFARKAGVSQSVGKDFAAADKGRSFAGGGSVVGTKGTSTQDLFREHKSYAQGGAVLPRSSDFKKEPNKNILSTPDRITGKKPPPSQKTSETWAKSGGPQGDMKSKDKSEAPVVPRK